MYDCSDKKSCLFQNSHELVRHCQEKEVECPDEGSDNSDGEDSDDKDSS
jgi:hypothetical protein